MKVTQEFVVNESPETVWSSFQDVPTVAGCLPGAELTEIIGDGEYEGKLSVKLGPMSSLFESRASLSPDEATMSALIEGSGVDKKGGSRGRVKVRYSIDSSAEGSKVNVDADITLAGPAAQFGRTGLINETSKQLINEFVACLEGKISAGAEAGDA